MFYYMNIVKKEKIDKHTEENKNPLYNITQR